MFKKKILMSLKTMKSPVKGNACVLLKQFICVSLQEIFYANMIFSYPNLINHGITFCQIMTIHFFADRKKVDVSILFPFNIQSFIQ